jgi:hypothetical protein
VRAWVAQEAEKRRPALSSSIKAPGRNFSRQRSPLTRAFEGGVE